MDFQTSAFVLNDQVFFIVLAAIKMSKSWRRVLATVIVGVLIYVFCRAKSYSTTTCPCPSQEVPYSQTFQEVETPFFNISLTGTDTPFFDISLKEDKMHYFGISLKVLGRVLKVTKGYSNFTYRRPYFIDDTSKRLFYKREWNNNVLDHVQTSKTFFANVYVVKNGRFDGFKYCDHKGRNDWIKKSGEVKPENWFKVLVPLTMVDGGTFQHFQDQVLLRLLQVLPTVRTHNATILLYAPRDKILYDLNDKWGISSQIVFYKHGEIYGADYVIHSCISDSLHPMIWRESRRVTGVQIKRQIPIRSAYIIVLTRAGCFNCGRKILNHNETVSMLESRYGQDLVKVFKGPQPLKYSLDLFGKARIIIGAHGGGFYNIMYAPEKTAIVEFMPTREDGETGIPGEHIFFKISSILYQDYWRVATPPKANKDIVINMKLLAKLLDRVDEMQLK